MPMDMSYADARNLIEGHLNKDRTDDDPWRWVKDIFDDKVIYEDDGTLYQATYVITAGEVTLGTPERVKTTYEKFAELKDVEVLRAGTFTSADGTKATFTEADLAQVLKNFNDIPDNKIPAVVGHADGDKSELINAATVGAPVISFMTDLRAGLKDGVHVLIADFGEMAEKAIDMIGKTLVRISPEIFTNFVDNEGIAHGKALRRISFIDRSAIRELPDVTADNIAFGDEPGQETMVIDLSETTPSTSKNYKGGTGKVSDEIKTEEDLIKLAETSPVVADMLAKQKKLEDEAKASALKLSEQTVATHKKEISSFLDSLTEAGKLAPAMRPSVEAFMEAIPYGEDADVIKFGESGKEKEMDPLGFFKEVLSAKESIITFGETEPSQNPAVVAGDVKGLIEKYQEEHPDVTYRDAASAVSKKHPDLFR